jgi:PhnB protein
VAVIRRCHDRRIHPDEEAPVSQTLNPYLNFRGQAADAMAFYASVFGGEPNAMTFREQGMTEGIEEGELDFIMHSQLETPAGFTLMVSDVPARMPFSPGSSISVSLSGDDHDALSGYYEKLAEGGTVLEPLTQAPWGDSFGMLSDRFGTTWLVNISAPAA